MTVGRRDHKRAGASRAPVENGESGGSGSEVADVPPPSRVPNTHLAAESRVTRRAEARVALGPGMGPGVGPETTPRGETRASGEAGMPRGVYRTLPPGERAPATGWRDMSIRPRGASIAAHVLPCLRRGVLWRLGGCGGCGGREADHERRGEAGKG